jgi:predicted Zn-dependent protease
MCPQPSARTMTIAPMKRLTTACCAALCLLFHQTGRPISEDLQIPSLGDASSSLFSSQQEFQLGRGWLMAFRNQAPIISDPLLTDYLEYLIYYLASYSQLKDRRLELVVVDNKSMNAFAVPGGVVGVHNGMFLHAETEDQMASVLSHELAHLSQRHFARGVEKQQASSITSLAALLGALVIAATAGGDAGLAAITAVQAASMENQLRFSRQNEQEADRIGMLTMVNADLDPMSVAAMFEQMQRSARYYGRPPEFLLTHPITERRISDARSRALRYQQRGPRDNLEYHLMRARVQMHFEKNVNASIKRFRTDIKDDSHYADAHRYGLVLALTEARRIDEAQAQLDLLLAKDPLRITYLVAQGELWLASGRPKETVNLLAEQLRYNPSNHPLTMTYYQALMRSGDTRSAEKLLTRHAKNRPTDPQLWYELAEARGLAGDIIGLHQARSEFFVLIGQPEQAIRQLNYALGTAGIDNNSKARINQRILEIQRWQEAMNFK